MTYYNIIITVLFVSADQSELITSKKAKKIKFGKVLKGKMKAAKLKGKTKKNPTGNDSESVADDLVIETSKVSSTIHNPQSRLS